MNDARCLTGLKKLVIILGRVEFVLFCLYTYIYIYIYIYIERERERYICIYICIYIYIYIYIYDISSPHAVKILSIIYLSHANMKKFAKLYN